MMKKLLLSLTLALTSLLATAQIPHNILGIELGSSGVSEVKTVAKALKLITETHDNLVYMVGTDGIEFGGYRWTMACVQMYNGKAMAVMFVQSGEEAVLNARFEEVAENLQKSFATYLRTDAELDMALRKVKPFSDGTTWVDVTEMGGNHPYVALTYMDCALGIQSQQNGK